MPDSSIKVKGVWKYLYRAVDSEGNSLDFLLSAKRDAKAAKRFLKKVLNSPHNQSPRAITVDKNAAYPPAIDELNFATEPPQVTALGSHLRIVRKPISSSSSLSSSSLSIYGRMNDAKIVRF